MTFFFWEKSQKNGRYICWDYFQYISQDLCPDNITIATVQKDKSQKYARDQSSQFVRMCMQITGKCLLTTIFISKMEIIIKFRHCYPTTTMVKIKEINITKWWQVYGASKPFIRWDCNIMLPTPRPTYWACGLCSCVWQSSNSKEFCAWLKFCCHLEILNFWTGDS